jgi:sugar lactone lactonase YvrE
LPEPTDGPCRCYRTGERPSFTPVHVLFLRPFRRTVTSAAIAGLVVAAAACNSSSSTNTGAGDLVLVISVPTGGNAAVAVQGPNSFAQTLTATGTLATIATGQYVITAGPARVGDPIVSQIDTGVVILPSGDSGVSQTLTLNNNTIDTIIVNYGPRPGSGFLWLTSTGNNATNRINGFYSLQLQNFKPFDSATVTIDGRPGQSTPGPIAVDLSGNLWVSTATGVIGQYLYGQLLHGTVAGPGGAQVSLAGSPTPTAIAFDPAGNLWVAIPQQVVKIAAVSLVGASGTVPAAATFNIPQLDAGPTGMAFDNLGTLWVAAADAGALIQLTSSQLAGTPGDTINVVNTLTPGVVAPLLDPSGRLWVVTTTNQIVAFSAEQTSTFTPTTAPSQTLAISTAGNATAAAFDNSGDIWITEGTANTLVELTNTQLQAGGTQVPTGTFTPPVPPNIVGLAFNPKAQFSPLAGQHAPPAPTIITKQGHRTVHSGA